MVQNRSFLLPVGLLLVLGHMLPGCFQPEYTCVECHTDQTLLEKIADDVIYPTAGGDG